MASHPRQSAGEGFRIEYRWGEGHNERPLHRTSLPSRPPASRRRCASATSSKEIRSATRGWSAIVSIGVDFPCRFSRIAGDHYQWHHRSRLLYGEASGCSGGHDHVNLCGEQLGVSRGSARTFFRPAIFDDDVTALLVTALAEAQCGVTPISYVAAVEGTTPNAAR